MSPIDIALVVLFAKMHHLFVSKLCVKTSGDSLFHFNHLSTQNYIVIVGNKMIGDFVFCSLICKLLKLLKESPLAFE